MHAVVWRHSDDMLHLSACRKMHYDAADQAVFALDESD